MRRAISSLIGCKGLTKSGLTGVGGAKLFAPAETDRPKEGSVFGVKKVLVFLVPAIEGAQLPSVTAHDLRKVILKGIEILSVLPRPKIPNVGKISGGDPSGRPIGGSESLVPRGHELWKRARFCCHCRLLHLRSFPARGPSDQVLVRRP